MKSQLVRASTWVLAFLACGSMTARAVSFTIDALSPSIPGIGFEDDIFNDPVPVPPAVPGSGAPGIDVNAFSYGRSQFVEPLTFYFSVNRGSVGLPGTAVNGEAFANDQSADIYVSTGAGFNSQFRDGDGIVANPATPGSPAPPLGLFFDPGTGDNVDGLDLRNFGQNIYWSVDSTTVANNPFYAGASAADIFMTPTVAGYSTAPAIYAPAGLLGLLPGDDMDAMVYFEDGLPGPTPGDIVLFSLTPASPTLGAGFSPADVLWTSPFAPGPSLYASANSLGLLASDDLNALDVIPELDYHLLALCGMLGYVLRRRLRC
jgi:hypothetical protein